MVLIKLLLLCGIAIVAFVAMRGGQGAGHKVFWRLSGIAVVVAAGLSVIFPDALTAIANSVGVQRGTDLLLYVLVVAFMLVVVLLFRRIGELEQRYVRLVRQLALDEGKATGKADISRNPE